MIRNTRPSSARGTRSARPRWRGRSCPTDPTSRSSCSAKVRSPPHARSCRLRLPCARLLLTTWPSSELLFLQPSSSHTHTANFSFALSLAKNHPVTASRLTATAYDSQATTYEKYPDAESNVSALVDLGATVLFDVDAGRLELTKEVKTQGLAGGGWDKVIWNFPHAGLGEKDQARNIALNQVLLLKFFRSVSPFLTKGASRSEAPVKVPKGKGKARESDDEEDREVEMVDEDGEEYLGGQMHEEEEEEEKETKKGTVLVTLRNAEPYTSWCACVLPCLRRVLADESVLLTLALSLFAGICLACSSDLLPHRPSPLSHLPNVLPLTRPSPPPNPASPLCGRSTSTRPSTRVTPTDGRSASSLVSQRPTTRRSTVEEEVGRSKLS